MNEKTSNMENKIFRQRRKSHIGTFDMFAECRMASDTVDLRVTNYVIA